MSVEHALSYLLLMLVLVLIIASVLMLKRRFSPGPTTPPLATNLSRARPSGSPPRTESPPRMRSAMPITEMWTGGRVRRRPTVPQRERPEIAAHRRVAEGRARPNDVVPNVIFQRPEVDWRPRKGRPFELSFFHSQIDALEHCAQSTWRAVLFGKWRWWMWLAERARVDALVEGLAAQLDAAPELEKLRGYALLDLWLTRGIADHFLCLRGIFREYRGLTLAQVHRREADAAEYKFGEFSLLAALLRSLVTSGVREGVLRRKPPSQCCVMCKKTYVEDDRHQVALACYLPCSHWMDRECWEAWRAARGGEDDYCPHCGNKDARATVVRLYAGTMVD